LSAAEALVAGIKEFLPCPTPDAWVAVALQREQESTLLIDHANCEKKAAATALALMHRYTDNSVLLNKMSRLAREELRHFEQVIKMMAARDIAYEPLSASRYAQGLHKGVRRQEPGRLIDTLIVGALIEARSCERFARLAPELDNFSLLKSEARHYADYLRLAESLADEAHLADRLDYFRGLEAGLVESADTEFRFHSGPVGTQH